MCLDVNSDMTGGKQVMCDVRKRAKMSGKILKHMKPGTEYNLQQWRIHRGGGDGGDRPPRMDGMS